VRRVVITGLGPVSCIGVGVHDFSEALRAGKNGISRITSFDVSGFERQMAGEIKDFDPSGIVTGLEVREWGRSSSGSSAACMRVSATIGATRLTYPAPPHEYAAAGETGIRIGIIARESRAEAWQVAHQRFPDDPQGRKSHRIATKLSPSTWHKELSRRTEMEDSPYWLLPFKTYKTFCPYLVGSYDEVGELLAFYHAEGVRTLILDTPSEEDDLYHAGLAFRAAGARTGLATTPAPATAVLER
jgi:hypothetical protein